MILAELTCAVTFLAGVYPRLDADYTLSVSGSAWQTDADYTVTGIADLVRPRTSRSQTVAPFKVTVGGVELPYWQRNADLTITESLESGWSFSFSIPRRGNEPTSFLEPLGLPRSYFGTPGGKAAVNIDARLIDSSGVHEYRLLTNGLLTTSGMEVADSPETRSFSGLGAHARENRKLVTYTVTPGHGLRRELVVRKLFEEAGVAANRINIGNTGRPLYKGVQFVDAALQSSADELLFPSLRKIHVDTDGAYKVIDLQPLDGQAIAWTFTEQDVLQGIGALTENSDSDGPTCVTVTGTKQITNDGSRRTETQVVETYANVPPVKAAFSQDTGASTLTAVMADTVDPAQLWLRSRITRELEYVGDTLISEKVLTEEWKNPQKARYNYATDGTIGGYISCYINESGAVADDGSLGYALLRERFVPTSLVLTRYVYDDRGFHTETVTDRSAFIIRRKAIKGPRSLASNWADEPYLTGPDILASGDGIDDVITGRPGVEVFQGPYAPWAIFGVFSTIEPAERITTTYDVSDDGFILAETTVTEGWIERPGQKYLYQSGFESFDAQSVFAQREKVQTIYFGSSEGTASKVTTGIDYLSNVTQKIENLDGYLPAAERDLAMVDPDWATTFNDDELAFAIGASRFESQSIKAKVCATNLLAVREAYEEKLTNAWAEDVEECQAIGVYYLRKGCTLAVDFPLPFNPFVRVGQMVHLSLPSVGIEHDVFVNSVSHSEDERGVVTTVSGEVWLL